MAIAVAVFLSVPGCHDDKRKIEDANTVVANEAKAVHLDADDIKADIITVKALLTKAQEAPDIGAIALGYINQALAVTDHIDAKASSIVARASQVETASQHITEALPGVKAIVPLWKIALRWAGVILGIVAVVAVLAYAGLLPLAFQGVMLAVGVVGRVLRAIFSKLRLDSLVAKVRAWHPWDQAEAIKAARTKPPEAKP